MVNDLLQHRLQDAESSGVKTNDDLATLRRENGDLALAKAALERQLADLQAQQRRDQDELSRLRAGKSSADQDLIDLKNQAKKDADELAALRRKIGEGFFEKAYS